MSAQELVSGKVDEFPSLTIHSFSYPLFLNGEQHSSFKLNYRITDSLQAELQGFYDTYLLTDRFRVSLLLKQYLTKKIYLFSGVEIEMEGAKSLLVYKRPPRVGFISAVGYDVTSDFIIEAKGNIGINKTSMGAFGEPSMAMPEVYTLGSKIKF